MNKLLATNLNVVKSLAADDGALIGALQTAITLMGSYQELSGKADDKNEIKILKLLTRLDIGSNELSKMFKSRELADIRRKFECIELKDHFYT